MNKNQIATRLRELRKTNNFNQEYVASYLNISRQAYSHYETGRNTPPPDILIKLSQLYNLPSDEFLALSSPIFSSGFTHSTEVDYLDDFLDFFSTPHNNSKYHLLTKNEKLLIYFYQKLPREEQTDFLEYLKIRARRFS